MSDAEVEDLIEDFVAAAKIARDVGFDFVDIKHCHGYSCTNFSGPTPVRARTAATSKGGPASCGKW